MFTGIVEDTGTIRGVRKKPLESSFDIAADRIDTAALAPGDSISVSGVCLTVTAVGDGFFSVDASRETLSRTTLGAIKEGSRVNIERALSAAGRLGGHIVSGHVDGVGSVVSREKSGDSFVFTFSVPEALSKYIVEKGSVAVDGVSLTVNSVSGTEFTVNIIPYTLSETTFGGLDSGSPVNIECDIIAKYVEKLTEGHRGGSRTGP